MKKDLPFNEIQEYLISKQIDFKTKGENTTKSHINICCPFCSDDRYHLGINLQTLQANCWRCGPKHLTIIVKEIERCSYRDAQYIADHLKVFNKPETFEPIETFKSIPNFLKYFNPNLNKVCRRYLEGRNFDPDYIGRKYKLMSSDIIGDFKYRLIAPIFMKYRPVSVIGRDVTNKSPSPYKLLSDEKSLCPREKILYNADTVNGKAILVEGIFDVFRIGNSAVATLSTTVSKQQILSLIKLNLKKIFIIFDSEEVAQKRAKNVAQQLAGFIRTVEVVDIGRGDPGEMDEEEANYIRKHLL